MTCKTGVLWFLCCLLATSAEAIRIISRDEWGARPSTKPPQPLVVDPVSHVVIHHSATERCMNRTECVQSVKYFQDLHIDDNKWDDIGYNFVVGEDGNIYEGRGWGKRGAHAPLYNSKSVGICIVGTFIDVLPNAEALRAVKNLIAFGRRAKKIRPCYQLMGHRQAVSTECPGETLFNEIKKWPRWTGSP